MHWVPPHTERHSKITHQLRQLGMVHKILCRKVMEEFPLHPGQLHILEYVREHPGCTQVEVAQQLLITPSSIAQSTKRMQREGLLEKHMRDENQRSKQLYVTERGREVAKGCREGFDDINHALVTTFSDEEILQMEGLLDRMLASAATYAGESLDTMDLRALIQYTHGMPPCKDDGGKDA